MKIPRRQGIEEAYVMILEDINKESIATIKRYKFGEKIPIQKGVRQDDAIFPKLFTVVLEEVFKNLEWEAAGIQINGENLNNLKFADDIVLMRESTDELQQMIL